MIGGMSKRAVAALLWFAAVWVGYELLWSVTGAPRVIGPIVAAAAAGFVTVDPRGVFWARSAPRADHPVATSRRVGVES